MRPVESEGDHQDGNNDQPQQSALHVEPDSILVPAADRSTRALRLAESPLFQHPSSGPSSRTSEKLPRRSVIARFWKAASGRGSHRFATVRLVIHDWELFHTWTNAWINLLTAIGPRPAHALWVAFWKIPNS